MSDDVPLILLPGLGADGRMFSSIRSDLPQLTTPPWIEPRHGESVVDYARRYAAVIDPGRPFFIGGASFGGVVAQEVSAVLPNVKACFVIGSIRSPKSRPWHVRILRPITPFIGILPWLSPLLVRLLGSWLRPPTRGVLIQLAEADSKFLRWAAQSILKWKPSPELKRVRVCQIHGERDRVFPIHLMKADQIVPGAGHLVAITHPRFVMKYLRDQMTEIDGEEIEKCEVQIGFKRGGEACYSK